MKSTLAVVIAAALGATLSASTFSFTPFSVPGALTTAAYGINNQGQIVGNFVNATGTHGFVKDGDNFTAFDVPGTAHPQPSGINSSGVIVGAGFGPFGTFGFLKDGAMFTTLQDPASAGITIARQINDAGQIVGTYQADSAPYHGFLLSDGTYTTIDVPGAQYTLATAINNSGQIVGGFADATGTHGFLKDGSQFIVIDVPGSANAGATGINKFGEIVGEYDDDSGAHGFLRQGNTLTTFDVPGAFATVPMGINDAGQIVGYFDGVPGDPFAHGFVTPPVRDIVPPNIRLSVTPNVLWPPNHKLVEITASVTATDNQDPNPQIALVSVTSNQPANTIGDGNTNPDIVVQNGRIFVRAERSGDGTDRIYTITYAATDASGNRATATATVTVPHS